MRPVYRLFPIVVLVFSFVGLPSAWLLDDVPAGENAPKCTFPLKWEAFIVNELTKMQTRETVDNSGQGRAIYSDLREDSSMKDSFFYTNGELGFKYIKDDDGDCAKKPYKRMPGQYKVPDKAIPMGDSTMEDGTKVSNWQWEPFPGALEKLSVRTSDCMPMEQILYLNAKDKKPVVHKTWTLVVTPYPNEAVFNLDLTKCKLVN